MDKEKIQNKINELQNLLSDELTEYNIILDRSGSMQTIKEDMEGGFQSWLESEKKLPGQTKVNLYQFDTQFETVYENRPLKEANLIINPRGGTALNDAIGKTISIVKDRHKTNKPGKTVFIIITDGEENSSREWTASSVKNLVEQQTKQHDWLFLYLGANQDAVLTGKDRGITKGKVLDYVATSQGTSDMWKSVSQGTGKVRGASLQSYKRMVDGDENVFDEPKSTTK